MSSTRSSSRTLRYSTMLSTSEKPGALDTSQRRRDHLRHRRTVVGRRQLAEPRPVGERATTSAATWIARRVFPHAPVPINVTSGASVEHLGDSSTSSSRPTNEVSCTGTLPPNASLCGGAENLDADRRARSGTSVPDGPNQGGDARRDREAPPPRRARARWSRAIPRSAHHARPTSAARHGSPHCRNSRHHGLRLRRCATPCAPSASPHSTSSPSSPTCAATAASSASCAVANTAWKPSPSALDDVAAVGRVRADDVVVTRPGGAHAPPAAHPRGESTLQGR